MKVVKANLSVRQLNIVIKGAKVYTYVYTSTEI
ncbi:hypothetical protein MCEGE14_01082 [Burkholderiaceae bacterium]